VHPMIADILTNDLLAETVAADLIGLDHGRSDCHSRDAAKQLQREGLAEEFLAEMERR